MKVKSSALSVFAFLLLSLSLFSAPAQIFAQSGKNTENKKPVEIQLTPEVATKPEIPRPKEVYEYIPPQNIVDFLYAAKAAGQRGFRLHKVTAVPSDEAETSKEKAGKTVLADLVRYDGEARYDYNFFFAEGEKEPELKLNALTERGWYFREVITVYGGGADSDPTGLFENTVYSLPNIGNIFLLERVSQEKNNRKYKLLKAGFGMGKNPTAKMQSLIDESFKENYAPVAVYHSFGATSIFSVDAFYGVLVEKNRPEDAEKAENASSPDVKFTNVEVKSANNPTEFRFVRANRNDGLRKELEKVSAEGFRIGLLNVNSAIVVRESEKVPAVKYEWLPTDEKTYAANFAKTAGTSGAEFYTVSVDMLGNGDFVRNVLVFENKPATENAANRYEYKTLRMTIPRKKLKKGEPLPPPPAETPTDIFKKMLGEGYIPRDVYYSDKESVNILFEKQK